MAVDELASWLAEHGLEKYAQLLSQNAIGMDVLDELEREDFKDLGIPVGDIRRFMRAIRMREDSSSRPVSEPSTSRSSPKADRAERRQLTVMFADLVGSTELSQALDPEDLRDLNRAYQDAAKAAVERFGGFLARYMGDGVLAYFGYPTAHEDDPERAIRAGLALNSAMRRLGTDHQLTARVGISTGPVVVGDLIGEGASQERAVVGETPNLAARLQGLAEPGSIVVGPATHRLAAKVFDYRPLGEQRLKGIANPTPAYAVIGERVVSYRLSGEADAEQAALVGREEELGLVISRWNSVVEGEGQLVLLSGEPGIGKSKLTDAILAHLSTHKYGGGRAPGESNQRLRYFCSPHHTGSALYPVIAQLTFAAGINTDDSPKARFRKLERLAEQAGCPMGDLPILASLLAIPLPQSYPDPGLAPELRQARTLDVLAGTLDRLARRQPVLLVLEDAQWMDPTTSELMGMAIERLRSLRALIVITCRPEYVWPWPTTHATTLSINRLNRRQGEQLITRLTGGKTLPEELRNHILDKTDGIPLFLEELTKSVLESQVVVETETGFQLDGPLPGAAVPMTLQDSLMARLDRLGDVREVAQVASVIGRTFSFELLRQITGLSDPELKSALARLVESELINERGVAPNVTYTFKHALVQDVAYGSLLNRRREEVHRQIAAALEQQAPDIVSAQPELLARHYTLGGQHDKAIAAWLRAGQLAASRSSHREAVSHLREGLRILSTARDTEQRAAKELAFHLALFVPLAASQFWSSSETSTAYARAEELCKRLDETGPLRHILFGKYSRSIITGDYPAAHETGLRLLELGRAQGSTSVQMNGHRWLCWPALYRGQLEQVREHIDKSLRLHDPGFKDAARGRSLVDPKVEALCIRSQERWLSGRPVQSLADSAEAISLARKLDHPTGLAYALTLAGLFPAALRGDAAQARTLSDDLLPLANDLRAPVFQAYGAIARGWALATLGEAEERTEGMTLLQEGVEDYNARGGKAYSTLFHYWTAELRLDANDLEGALASIQQGLTAGDEIGERFFESELYRLRAAVLERIAPHELDQALSCYRHAIDVSRAQGARQLELRACTDLARRLVIQGQLDEARKLLAPLVGDINAMPNQRDYRLAREVFDAL